MIVGLLFFLAASSAREGVRHAPPATGGAPFLERPPVTFPPGAWKRGQVQRDRTTRGLMTRRRRSEDRRSSMGRGLRSTWRRGRPYSSRRVNTGPYGRSARARESEGLCSSSRLTRRASMGATPVRRCVSPVRLASSREVCPSGVPSATSIHLTSAREPGDWSPILARDYCRGGAVGRGSCCSVITGRSGAFCAFSSM